MEYIVDGFEVEWEAKAPSVGRHDLGDREGAQSFVVEFFHGAAGLYVARVEPY